MIDYHFGPELHVDRGLILYPHFFQKLTPGWFDKLHKQRSVDPSSMENVLLLAPSYEFVATLPGGRIPDRNDFYKFDTDERIRRWQVVVEASEALAQDLELLFDSRDALARALS